MSLVTRASKGSLVTHAEFDNNLTYLQSLALAAQAGADAKATLAQVDARVQAVVGAAPAALDTLVEIAAQMAADETAAAALTSAMSTKASLSADNAFAGLQSFGKAVVQKSIAVAAAAIDAALGSHFTKTITANTTFTVANAAASGSVSSFLLDLTNGGAFTITWWAGVKWAGGTAPTLTAAGRDTLGFYTYDGGSTWTGVVLGKDIK